MKKSDGKQPANLTITQITAATHLIIRFRFSFVSLLHLIFFENVNNCAKASKRNDCERDKIR
jgi:hypothetical protein